jgi:hypothetical protein
MQECTARPNTPARQVRGAQRSRVLCPFPVGLFSTKKSPFQLPIFEFVVGRLPNEQGTNNAQNGREQNEIWPFKILHVFAPELNIILNMNSSYMNSGTTTRRQAEILRHVLLYYISAAWQVVSEPNFFQLPYVYPVWR